MFTGTIVLIPCWRQTKTLLTSVCSQLTFGSNRCSKQVDSLFTHPNRKSKDTLWPVWKTWLCLSVHTPSLPLAPKSFAPVGEPNCALLISCFDAHTAFLWSKWMTAALSNLPLYVFISDWQSRPGVNQQPSHNRRENAVTETTNTHTQREDLGMSFVSICPLVATLTVSFL